MNTMEIRSETYLVVKIVTLTGALTDAGEHGVTTVVHGDVVNKLHDNDLYTQKKRISNNNPNIKSN